MEAVRVKMLELKEYIERFQEGISLLKPKRGELRWFGKGRLRPHLELLYRGSEDVLKHASTMIGYFDGFAARGVFQERVASVWKMPMEMDLELVLKHLLWSLQVFSDVLQEQIQRESLVFSKKGPSKPGPIRTLHISRCHLESLKEKLCAVVLKRASSQRLRQNAQRFLQQ